MVANEARATTIDHPARALPPRRTLLLDVGLTNGGGRYGAPDQTDDRDERQHVGQGLEEHGSGGRVDGKLKGERAREPEEDRRAEGAERSPLAEDEGGEADEPLTLGHVLVE